MSMKGKQLKQSKAWRELSPDIQVYGYLRDKKEFDSAIWGEYTHDDGISGFLLLPYKNGYWMEDKIWFTSLPNMNKFCMLCGCSVIMESD